MSCLIAGTLSVYGNKLKNPFMPTLTQYIKKQISYGLHALHGEHGEGGIRGINFLAGKFEYSTSKGWKFKKFRFKIKNQAVTVYALGHQITVEYS